VAAITGASVLASLVVTLSVSAALDPWNDLHGTLLVAVLVPLIVAPLVSHSMMGLLYELERVRDELHQVAIRDGLTHAYNRRFFMARLEVEGERARRDGQPLSVMMIDVDRFKAINDGHGHATGDLVLERMARLLIDTLRPYDVIARYGGEEFVALLPGTTLAQAVQIAERVRSAVEAQSMRTAQGATIAVTASLGVATLAGDAESPAAMLERADHAMYRAKNGGRNRCVADPGPAVRV
jgi:diguanylate cyclase (GGDEF)-like protein